jgi:hypothetical protein
MPLDSTTAWIQQVTRDGHEACVWAAFSQAKASMSATEWEACAQRLADLDLPPGKPSFFRAVFLFFHTGSTERLAQAGIALRECGELERRHAFLVLVWGMAISSSGDRPRFRNLIEQAGFPGNLHDSAAVLADTLAAPGRDTTGAGASETAVGNAGSVRRVAVLAQHLSNNGHPGTQLALEHAALLRGAGIDVRVFSALEFQGTDLRGWLGSPQKVEVGLPTPSKWKSVCGPMEFRVVMAKGSWPHEGRWQAIATKLCEYAPDVVLFVGFFSPLMAWAWRHFPVVGLSVHSLPPLGPVDVWLHQFEAGQTLPQPWAAFSPAAPIPYTFRMPAREGTKAGLAPLKLEPDAQIVVTVGYRLSKEMSAEWAAGVVARLEAHPRWVWLLVGEGAYPACLPRGHPRIKVLPHQENLDGILQQCHLYLNPKRMGGGFSVLQAMARRVPVVSHVGTDGGDKLGEWAVTSDAQYWQCVDQLLVDEGERTRRGDALYARFATLYNLRAAVPALLAALGEGCRLFAQRMRQTP